MRLAKAGVALALVSACRAAPPFELVELAAPPEGAPPIENRTTASWRWCLPDALPLELEGRPVGNDAFAIDELPDSAPYSEVWVVTATRGHGLDTLAFVFVQADGRRGIALLESRDGASFQLAAHVENQPAAWDWAVVSPDGRRVAVWGRPLDLYERAGEQLLFRRTLGAGYVKAFPRFSPTGRLAARLVGGADGTQAVLVDDSVGPPFDRVDPPVFDASGEHVIYSARRDGESFLVVDDALFGPYAELRLHEGTRADWIVTFEARIDGRWQGYGLR